MVVMVTVVVIGPAKISSNARNEDYDFDNFDQMKEHLIDWIFHASIKYIYTIWSMGMRRAGNEISSTREESFGENTSIFQRGVHFSPTCNKISFQMIETIKTSVFLSESEDRATFTF